MQRSKAKHCDEFLDGAWDGEKVGEGMKEELGLVCKIKKFVLKKKVKPINQPTNQTNKQINKTDR